MLTLTNADLMQLQQVMTTLLSPLEFERAEDWSTAAMEAIRPLLGSDHVFVGHALHGPAAHPDTGGEPPAATSPRAGNGQQTDPRSLRLLQLLLPAYRAGLTACSQLARRRADLASLLDHAADAIYVTDASGRTAHHNCRLTELLSEEPEGTRLLAEARSMATVMLSLEMNGGEHATDGAPSRNASPASRRLRTARDTYRLNGLLLDGATMGTRTHAAIVIAPLASQPPCLKHVRERYGLTSRELEVARLLASGRSTREIADAMRVSPHTARHHTESVMRKLGVKRRAEVGARLRGD